MFRFLWSTNQYKPRNQSKRVETDKEANPQFCRAPPSLQKARWSTEKMKELQELIATLTLSSWDGSVWGPQSHWSHSMILLHMRTRTKITIADRFKKLACISNTRSRYKNSVSNPTFTRRRNNPSKWTHFTKWCALEVSEPILSKLIKFNINVLQYLNKCPKIS